MISTANQIELRHLRYFCALAAELHYRKAAEALLISQSALSQQIMQLEHFLDLKLIDRANKKVVLTQAGRVFLKDATRIINSMEVAIENVQLVNSGSSGKIGMGYVGSAMQLYLPKLIRAYLTKYPKTKLRLEELSNSVQLQRIEEGTLDIGFLRSNKITPEMEMRKVFSENLVLVLPSDHKLNPSNFKNMGQVKDENFILFPNDDSQLYFQKIIDLCIDNGFRPTISHETIQPQSIFRLVEAGLGISIVPMSLVDRKNYKIKFIELKNVKQKTVLYAVWRKDNERVPLIRLRDEILEMVEPLFL